MQQQFVLEDDSPLITIHQLPGVTNNQYTITFAQEDSTMIYALEKTIAQDRGNVLFCKSVYAQSPIRTGMKLQISLVPSCPDSLKTILDRAIDRLCDETDIRQHLFEVIGLFFFHFSISITY